MNLIINPPQRYQADDYRIRMSRNSFRHTNRLLLPILLVRSDDDRKHLTLVTWLFSFLMYTKAQSSVAQSFSQKGNKNFNKLVISNRLGVGDGDCCILTMALWPSTITNRR